MKRQTYVDEDGNTIDQSLESKRPILNFFFIFGTILPIIIIFFIIFTVIQNNNCSKIYNIIKNASLKYAQDQGTLPNLEGENIVIRLDDLYNEQYLSSPKTNNTLCSGSVKLTKYKNKYIYTVNAKNCGKCSVNKKYSKWSKEQTAYPSGKAIIDVIPYYNYYKKESNYTKWTDYLDETEIADEISEYGIKLPLDKEKLPKIPAEGKIANIENDMTYYYRYRTRSWKWYDIKGDYSAYSSEQPKDYANKDTSSEKYSEWSEYTLNYPEEKEYRTITSTTGYKYYYQNEQGKKIYFNNGQYTASTNVNTEKYNKKEEETATLYRYRDKQWRWYNGTRRKYSGLTSKMPNGKPYKDTETETLGTPTAWSKDANVDDKNAEYRISERKIMTRFRIEYDILSLKVLKKPLNHSEFEKKIKTTILEFASNPNYELEITYKFKYRKS